MLIAALVWGRWRHDIVAFAALLAAVLLGLVPARDAFAGFAHPAVVTVALVLVVSAGLMRTGAIHLLGLEGTQALILLLFSAMPTASTCYVLAARMGYNGPYVAGLVTLSTVLGVASLPFALSLVP